jgi:hypothetical protein
MSEFTQILVGTLAILSSLTYAFAYALGGRDKAPLLSPRIWKRIIAPLLFSALVIGLNLALGHFKLLMLLYPMTFVIAHYLLKYGGETVWRKLGGRLLAGLIIGLSSLPIAMSVGAYELLLIQVLVASSAHMVLGLTNPVKAPQEELLISLLTVIFVPFMGM